MYRSICRMVLGWLCLGLMFVGQPVDAADQRPNFIIIIGDDISPEDLGCYGNPRVRTPHVDQLAKDGLRCDAAFLTISSCSPSRASIMTGRYPHSTGAGELHQPLPADQVVFAGLLKQAGYYTAAAGKWHLGKPAEANFDKIVGGGASGCENWVQVLAERPKDQPFFCWFAAFDAHRGYGRGAVSPPHTREDVIVPPYLPDVPPVRDDLALYYDEVSRLDRFVGDVLAELDRQKVADNTLVLYMADNGRPFPRCKTAVYDSGVRTPLVIRWPGHVKPGTVSQSLVSSVDIAPTLIELAGLPPAKTFQGRSFAPLLKDPQATIREHIFAEHNWHDYQAHERAVRSTRYLYVRNAFPQLTHSPPADAVRSPTYAAMQALEAEGKLPADQRDPFVQPRPAEELFDVVADPFQLRNLASDPAQAPVLAEMRSALDDWIRETSDAVPQKPTPDKFDRVKGTPIPAAGKGAKGN